MDTALPTVGLLIWRWIELHGIDAGELFATQGIAKQDLQPHRGRVVIDRLDQVLVVALEAISDECCGLRGARCWHPSDLGALGYAWLASSSLGTALQRLERYSRVVGERSSIVAVDTSSGMKVVLDQNPRDVRVRALMADLILSLVIDMCRFNAGESLRPVSVTLRRERPNCRDRYSEFFGCDVQFSSDQDTLTIARHDADRPLSTSNRQLAGLHDQVLMRQLALLNQADIATRARAVILDNLTSGGISMEQIAETLHVSPRTLMRRLESQGTSLKQLVDQTRAELAERYLADPRMPITEVAFLLGFSHPSSLSRASNRWFGLSPIGYRSKRIADANNLQ